ncbi:GAF domain-containing sensor histidine kinase [Amycolatopsis minnesotensis]|uniref:GAF domain-containing protein n=1 Tax=Amycolatopsis minnesotensis TaxID=337894 RepID=A0ABN2S4F9_9PSEU
MDPGERRARWLRASNDITGSLLSGNDPKASLLLVAERARQLAEAPVAAIALPDEQRPGNLVFEVVDGVGLGADQISGLSVPIAETGSGHVFVTGKAAIFRQYGNHVLARTDDPSVRFPPQVADLDSSVVVPLAAASDVLGVLVLVRFRGDPLFTEGDLEMAETFAAHAAVALVFARAAETRRRLAVLEDRDRIARGLHDLVIQRLFAVGLGLDGLRSKLDGEHAETVGGFVAQLDETIHEVRRTIFSLHEEQDRLRADLVKTTREAAASLGFEPHLRLDGPLDSLVPDTVRPDLLATLRDTLSDIARAGQARAVEVGVRVEPDGSMLELRVTDDEGADLRWRTQLREEDAP